MCRSNEVPKRRKRQDFARASYAYPGGTKHPLSFDPSDAPGCDIDALNS